MTEDRFTVRAEAILHEWAALPDYEPLDEDMAINLVCRIRDALRAEAARSERLEVNYEKEKPCVCKCKCRD